jgi:PKD repeat protein
MPICVQNCMKTLARALVLLVLLSLSSTVSWAGTFAIGEADGSFEAGLDGMVIQGDVRLVASFGSLRPTQGTQALLLTTAPDTGPTLADADVSLVRIEHISIPISAEQLRLDYNFLTDELTPSFTNDRFSVKLLLISANGEETLLQVDTFASLYPAPLTGHAKQTGFRTLVADLAAYSGSGEDVTLELRLVDVGDGRVNSAVFLDNLQFTALGEPLACANVEYIAVDPGETVYVHGSCSTDADGSITEYRWDFGDGTVQVGRFAEHAYSEDGIYQVTLTVTDDTGNTGIDTFVVVVGAINHAPRIVSVPMVHAAEHTPYRYEVVAEDPERAFGDVLTFSLAEAPAGMDIDVATGVVTWAPMADAPRQHAVTVEVEDSFGLRDIQAFTVTVGPEVYIVAADDAGSLYYARSNGDGTFADYRFIEDTGSNTRGVAIADFDGDGDFDVVSGHAENPRLHLYYYERVGAWFAPPVSLGTVGESTISAGNWLMDMAAADVNNDGALDFVVNSDSTHSWLFRNQGQISFDQTTFFGSDFEVEGDAWGGAQCNTSFARDDSTTHSGNWAMRVFATADASCLSIRTSPSDWQLFQGPTLTFAYRIPPGVPVGLLVEVSGHGWVFLGGSSAASSGLYASVPATHLMDDDAWHTATIDLYHGIRQQWPEAGQITAFAWWTGTRAPADSQFWFDDFRVTRRTYVAGFAPSLMANTSDRGRGMDATDVDRDGNVDLARGHASYGQVFLAQGDGTGHFTLSPIAAPGSDPYGVALADFDNDGKVDLIANHNGSGDAYFFKGNGDGTFQSGVYIASLDTNSYAAYGTYDFDNDGNQDLVVVDYVSRRVWYYPGHGDTTFGAPVLIGTTSSYTLGVAAPAGRTIGQPFSVARVDTDTIQTGGTITFDASGSYDDGTIVDYTWDFGDGATASGAVVMHTFAAEGIYAVVLTITDEAGKQDRRSLRVTVAGTPPVASAGGSYTVGEAAAINGRWPVVLDGSASTDAETAIVRYEWDFDASDGVGVDATGINPRHTYTVPGTYTVTLTVYDEANQASGATATVTVQAGMPPVAALDGPAVVDETVASLGTWAVRVDLSGASDDLGMAGYTLDWGDGSSTTIGAMRENFDDGDFTGNPMWTIYGGSWQVTDGQLHQVDTSSGWKWLQQLSLEYRDFILQVDFKGVSSGGQMGLVFRNANSMGNTETFLLSSDDDWNVWRFSDWHTNTILQEGGNGWDPGIWYHLKLVVVGNTMQLYVTPEGGAETLQLEASDASHPVGSIGLLANGQHLIYDNLRVTLLEDSLRPMHIYSAAGDYQVTLTAIDHAAQSDTAELTTSVTANAPPVADPGGPYVLTESDAFGGTWAFRLDASGSTDDHGIQRYHIDFGDGTHYTTGFASGTQGSFFAAGTDLYGYNVPEARLGRIIATEDGTEVEVIDLTTKAVLAFRTLNRFEAWDMSPGDGVYFKVKATKPVVVLQTNFGSHVAFIPSLDASPVGHEFIVPHQSTGELFVYAIADTVVQFFSTDGTLVTQNTMRAGTYWQPSTLSQTMYHVVATGKITMQTVGSTGYTTVPAASGDDVGRRFFFATSQGTTGAFVVFAYADAQIEVFDLDTDQSLYAHTLAQGESWFQPDVGTRRLRLESTGDVEVWAGDTAGGTSLLNLGDDISVTTGRNGQEFYLHTLQDGLVIYAPHNGTTVTMDDGAFVTTLNRDEFVRLTPADFLSGAEVHHILASNPVLIQTLGRANGYKDTGTYLGGVAARHDYTAPGLYSLSLTVTDRAGQSHTATTTVEVRAGDPPMAHITGPAVVDETFASGGQWTVAFDASESSDDLGIFSYGWDFGDGTTGTGVHPTHAYMAPGTYTVMLTVTDHAGQQTTTTLTVIVQANTPPVAAAGGPYVVGEAAANRGVWTVTLDASGSTDDVAIYDYEWVFEPEREDFAGTSIDPTKWLVSAGVTQDEHITIEGAGSWGARYVFSAEHFARPLTVQAQIRPVNTSGTQHAMWGLKSTDTTGFSFITMPYAIYFANNNLYIYEDGVSRGLVGAYTRGVLYDLRITVQSHGAIYEFKPADAATWTRLYTSNHSSATPLQIGGTVLSGTFAFDTVQRTDVRTGPVVTKTYEAPGVYSATLRVRDHALQTSMDATTITVEAGAPPVAHAGGPYVFEGSKTIQFRGSASTDDVSIAEYLWDFGDATQSRAVNPSHVYRQVGLYTVTLTVTDHALQTDTTTTTVQVGRISQVEHAGVTGDWQTLEISGTVGAEVFNPEADPLGAFTVTFFNDSNTNGRFDAGVDTILGSASQDGLPAGDTVLVSAPVAGTVPFRDQLIYAFLDEGHDGAVADGRNYANSGQTCAFVPPVGTFEPVLEWAWIDTTGPSIRGAMMTPVVAPLIDTNGDSQVDERDVPAVIFIADGNRLVAVRGDDGTELWQVTDALYRVGAGENFSQIAVGDIDGDGVPEILTVPVGGGRLIAFEHDGTFKWFSGPVPGLTYGGPALADLDHDGVPEIIAAATVLNANGTVRWTGSFGRGVNKGVVCCLSAVADVDLDGTPEIITGNTVYSADGEVLWRDTLRGDGWPAVANFDADPFPEIVVVSQGTVRLYEHDGTLAWGPVALPGGGSGGPPTVADVDGDGAPEIGVAGLSQYSVLETTGTVKWSSPTQDASSQITSSAVFDFEGDGRVEVVYNDERFLRVYRGSDGAVLFETPNASGTLLENPVIADVDRDGNAEIVAVRNNWGGFGSSLGLTAFGVFVYGDAHDQWVNTRGIWNQHTYHITNVNEDGSVPPQERQSWEIYNAYRANFRTAGLSLFAAPDLTASLVRIVGSQTGWHLIARIGNGGALLAPPGVPVAFYDGAPHAGGTLLGTASTSTSLAPGTFEDVTLAVSTETLGTVWVVADDQGNSTGTVNECREDNNQHDSGLRVRPNQPPVADAGGPYVVDEGQAVYLDGSGSTDLDGDTLTYAWDLDHDGAYDDGSGMQMTHTFTDHGIYTVGLEVRDTLWQDTQMTTVTVHDLTPTAAFIWRPEPQDEGSALLFTDQSTSTPDTLAAWNWDFAGQGTSHAQHPSFTFPDEGDYPVALTVTDDDGSTATIVQMVTVRNVAPTVDAGPDQTATAGKTVSLVGAFTDPGADLHTIEWTFGDGTTASGTLIPTHIYEVPGNYNVTLQVTDNDGGVGSDTVHVTVKEAAGPAPAQTIDDLYARSKDGKIDLVWTTVSDAIRYEVYRSTNGAAYVYMGNVDLGAYADFGLTNGVEYCYYVLSIHAEVTSLPSNRACAIPSARRRR